MSLEKIEEIIKSMEETSNEIKKYQIIYEELSNLQLNISDSIEDLKENKETLDKINEGITNSISTLKEKVESLNSLLPQKMLEIINLNKDIQIDMKTKHNDMLKMFDSNLELIKQANSKTQEEIISQSKKQFRILIFMSIGLIIVITLNIIMLYFNYFK